MVIYLSTNKYRRELLNCCEISEVNGYCKTVLKSISFPIVLIHNSCGIPHCFRINHMNKSFVFLLSYLFITCSIANMFYFSLAFATIFVETVT